MSGVPSGEVPLLGVIDLRFGRAVHAIAGCRDQYRPLRIPSCPDADPVALAEHYRGLGAAGLQIAGIYVADLDRIIDHSDRSQAAIDRLRALGLPLWIDRGLKTAADYADAETSRTETALPPETARTGDADAVCRMTWIVGTESLRSLGELRKMVQQQEVSSALTGPSSLAVSLDLREGQVVSAAEELAGHAAWEVAEMVAAAGVERLIVLDVARVGTASGPSTAPLCQRIKQRMPELTMGSGGGVRDAADAAVLRDAGCDFVLAGTWLHLV